MFFHTVEFYVILVVVAAAIVGIAAMPAHGGEVKQHLLAGKIFAREDGAREEPSVEFVCRDDGSVLLWRRGLEGIHPSGAVSLAVYVKDMDVTIEERLTPGRYESGEEDMTDATFELKFLSSEYYHVRYNSDETGLMATFTLHNRPGIAVKRQLRR